MRAIDADALLERVCSEKIQAQAHGREFSTCFMSTGGTPSTEWWFVEDLIENAHTIEPERKKGEWTKKELTIFARGIALSLLLKRPAQHWHYDDDTAKEIEFLETLYKKVMEIILYD